MQIYSKEQLIEMLTTLLNESSNVSATVRGYQFGSEMSEGKFEGWRTKILYALKNINIDASETINVISVLPSRKPKSIEAVEEQLKTLIDSIKNDYIQLIQNEEKTDPQQILEQLFNRFHKVARQLRTRHNDRNTINISDEYDVQDLLNALLQIFFDDIRPEEWTPSYAGSAVRMDFLIKDIDTVIEVKKTRKSMTAKDLGEQLIIDIEKYQEHPNCKQLICFVYDPEGLLGNPSGIKNDLESRHKDFLKVYIKPE